MSERKRKISLKTKLGFSCGALDEAMIAAAAITTMIFYNQVLGLSAALCGTAFLIASLIDGRRSVAAIVAELKARYPEVAELGDDVEQFMEVARDKFWLQLA